MEQIMYSVSADLDSTDLRTDKLPWGQAKFMYDHWVVDSEVFNVIMYRY